MKENLKTWIIGAIIALILIIPIIISGINSKKIETKTYSEFYDSITSTNFALYYFGDTSKSEYKQYKETLINMRKEYSVPVYVVNTKELTSDETQKLIALNEEYKNENVYAFIVDNELRKVTSNKLSEEKLSELINKYYNNVIPDSEIAYKTVSTYKEYMELVKSKKITMAVFGRNSCTWCNKFKPVYNEVAAEYNLDIYYFDSDSFSSTEYNKILNSGLLIPAKCTKNNESTPLSSGFGTPLTLFTQNGKSIDCISGYKNKTGLINSLKEVGLIKE